MMTQHFVDDSLLEEDELDNWISMNRDDNHADNDYDNDYFADEKIANGSAEAGEMKRDMICSLLWNKKLLRTNLTDF